MTNIDNSKKFSKFNFHKKMKTNKENFVFHDRNILDGYT